MMRITVGDISKAITEAMGAAPDLERTAGRWARWASRSDFDREARGQKAWTKSDDSRVRSVGNKLARMMHSAIMNMLEDDTPEHRLTAPELLTISKMTHQEITDAISDANIMHRIPSDVATWVQQVNNR